MGLAPILLRALLSVFDHLLGSVFLVWGIALLVAVTFRSLGSVRLGLALAAIGATMMWTGFAILQTRSRRGWYLQAMASVMAAGGLGLATLVLYLYQAGQPSEKDLGLAIVALLGIPAVATLIVAFLVFLGGMFLSRFSLRSARLLARDASLVELLSEQGPTEQVLQAFAGYGIPFGPFRRALCGYRMSVMSGVLTYAIAIALPVGTFVAFSWLAMTGRQWIGLVYLLAFSPILAMMLTHLGSEFARYWSILLRLDRFPQTLSYACQVLDRAVEWSKVEPPYSNPFADSVQAFSGTLTKTADALWLPATLIGLVLGFLLLLQEAGVIVLP